MTALIDADSLVYVIGWNYKDAGDERDVKASCDNFLKDILTLTQADNYIGVFSPPSSTTFRYFTYKYAVYKGTRKPEEEWIKKWKPVIQEHYIKQHGFIMAEGLEADDVVAAIAVTADFKTIICSPDKDLKQIAGNHYDYKKEGAVPMHISMTEANYAFWLQMLMGDSSDNVAGVPGLGEVKGKKILDGFDTQIEFPSAVLSYYRNYFGAYYGKIIFEETLDTLMMMSPHHDKWSQYVDKISGYMQCARVLEKPSAFFDLTS